MLSDEVIEKVTERLVNRIEQGNTYILEQIGKSINKVGTLTPSKAQELVQIMRYGGDYDKIVKKLAEITELNVKDIYKIFKEVAKENYLFAEQFYKYRNKKYIPFDENTVLQNQVRAIAKITADNYVNLSNTIAFATHDAKGHVVYNSLAETYQNTLDKAIINAGQGKETFDSAMRSAIKELVDSGIRTVDYESGRSMRLESAVRMAMQGGLRDMNNQLQQQFGEEFGANMIEVSHHSNSAPDHINTIDGKQFARIDVIKEQIKNGIEKEIKLSDIDGNRVKVKGKWYDDFENINNNLVRPVSTLNCYHYTFAGILGINQPQHTEKELKRDKEKNLRGFEYENKHYSLYEGQQLMRRLELELRKAKDMQIMGRSVDDIATINKAQSRITLLTNKYNKLLKASKLPSQIQRARVSDYRRISTKKLK